MNAAVQRDQKVGAGAEGQYEAQPILRELLHIQVQGLLHRASAHAQPGSTYDWNVHQASKETCQDTQHKHCCKGQLNLEVGPVHAYAP